MPNTNTDKNVYLLGAGFSKEIGIPIQDDFLLVAKEVFFKNTSIYKHFEKVFDYQDKLSKMRKFLNYPLLNLEHLFNLIEMDIFYSKSKEVENIKNDFIKLICDVIIERTPCPVKHDANGRLHVIPKYQKYIDFISLFTSDFTPQSVRNNDTIISFNYDLVIESSCLSYNYILSDKDRPKAKSIYINTIFEKSNIDIDKSNHYYTNNVVESWFPDLNIYSPDDSSLKLLKLHGSINWKKSNNKTFIVPPTWNKSDPEIRKLWEIAYNELKTAKRIIVIGYSFPETDIYVKSLLALALNENKILQNIFFVNPDKEIAKNTCLSLLDKHFQKYCAYKEWTFSEFISSQDGKKFINDSLNRKIISP